MKYAIYVIAAGILWGILSVFINVLNAVGFTSMECVALRAAITAGVLFFYLLLRDREKLKIRPLHLLYFVGTGVCSIVFFNFCYFKAIAVIGGAAVPALLLYTAPIFVMILSAICFKERITIQKIIALVLTFVGLGIVTGAFVGGESISVTAILLGLGSGLGYALYSIFGKFVVDKYDSLTITFYTFLIAAAVAVPTSGVVLHLGALCQIKPLFATAALAVVSTVLPFLLYTKGLKGIEAGKASILATVEPFTAAIIGVIFFHETFTLAKIIGMLLIVASILYLNLGAGKKDSHKCK